MSKFYRIMTSKPSPCPQLGTSTCPKNCWVGHYVSWVLIWFAESRRWCSPSISPSTLSFLFSVISTITMLQTYQTETQQPSRLLACRSNFSTLLFHPTMYSCWSDIKTVAMETVEEWLHHCRRWVDLIWHSYGDTKVKRIKEISSVTVPASRLLPQTSAAQSCCC